MDQSTARTTGGHSAASIRLSYGERGETRWARSLRSHASSLGWAQQSNTAAVEDGRIHHRGRRVTRPPSPERCCYVIRLAHDPAAAASADAHVRNGDIQSEKHNHTIFKLACI